MIKRWFLVLLFSVTCFVVRGDEPDYGKIADAFETLAVEFRKLAPTSPPTPPALPSGPQTPILTADRLAVLKRMQSDNHVYWQTLKDYADRTVAGNPIYDDIGLPASIVYQTTGDKSYAAAAYKQLMAAMAKDGRAANDVRQRYVDYQLVYTWVADTLTADQKTAFYAEIQQWSNYCLGIGQAQYVGSFRLNDSDQTIGQFLGLVLQDALGLPPGDLLQRNTINLNTGKAGAPVGGLIATAADTSTVRNTINWYVSVLAAGGEWPESSQYDSNTVRLLLTGWLSHWDASGKNSFPEIAAWVPTGCNAAVLDWTPALESRVLWGDNESDQASGPDLYKTMPYLASLQYAANRVGATDQAAMIGGLIKALEIKYPDAVAQAEVHFFFYCDPYSPIAAFRTPTAKQVNYSPGVGMYRRIDGDTLFFGYSPSRIGIDHEFDLVGDLRLFAKGEWVLNEPISYGGTGFANTSNSLTVSGISSMHQQGYVQQVTTDDYTYLNALTAGPLYGLGESWNPPPMWCRELRRQTLYLPKMNAIVICDRINSDDPRAMRPDFTGYTADDAVRIKASAHRHQWYWNAPVKPTVAPNSFAYSTAGGQQVRFDYFSTTSAAMQTSVVDESQAWATSGIPADQLKWDVQINPPTEQAWDCVLTLIRLDPSSTVPQSVTTPGNLAGFSFDGAAVLFSSDSTAPIIDPSKYVPPSTTTNRTYLVGCGNDSPVTVK